MNIQCQLFDHIKDKHSLYCGKYCMKKFCECLREYTKSIIDFETKKMLPLTRKEFKSPEDAERCYICGIKFFKKFFRDNNYRKVGDHCHYTGKYRGAAHSICNLKFNVPNQIPVVFHNSSNYDHHFIIKELANEFEEEFECIVENKERYKTFSVLTKKKIKKLINMVIRLMKLYLKK